MFLFESDALFAHKKLTDINRKLSVKMCAPSVRAFSKHTA